jgi:hypothetical protein
MKKPNKKALGPVAIIIMVVMFMVMWFLWAGKWVAEAGQTAVTSNSLTGVEAFLYSNINLFVLIALFLGIIAWSYFGST